jgi:hypothetical protein
VDSFSWEPKRTYDLMYQNFFAAVDNYAPLFVRHMFFEVVVILSSRNALVMGTVCELKMNFLGNFMRFLSMNRLLLLTFVLICSIVPSASAAPYIQGPDSCSECHEDEYDTWKKTQHFKVYRSGHKHRKAKIILKSVGGRKNMRRNDDCWGCHYSSTQKSASAKPRMKYGPACEECHGASSVWDPLHVDYGGRGVKKEDESEEHKAKRIADSIAGGMVWASMTYDLAAYCMKCHGLARSEISGKSLAKMLRARHPLNHDFEVVLYSQGKMSHAADERSPAQLAKFFIAGQAAKLVSASEAVNRSKDAKYKKEQLRRIADATAALKNVPQASEFIDEPSEANARKMMQEIGEEDLSGIVNKLIPCPKSSQKNLRQC